MKKLKEHDKWKIATVELVFRAERELNEDDVRAYLHGHGTGVTPARFNIVSFEPLMREHPAYGQMELDLAQDKTNKAIVDSFLPI